MGLLPRETVGQRIKIARQRVAAALQRPVSQADFAEMCGWGQSRLANYERDKRRPKIEDIQKIAKLANVPAEWITYGSSPPAEHEELSDEAIQLARLYEAMSEAHKTEFRNYLRWIQAREQEAAGQGSLDLDDPVRRLLTRPNEDEAPIE